MVMLDQLQQRLIKDDTNIIVETYNKNGVGGADDHTSQLAMTPQILSS